MKGIIVAVLLVCLLAGTAFAAVLTSTTQTITQEIVAPPPSGGGGGGGGGPTGFPPVFSNILTSGITETGADIYWETDLYSTSQVEYWPSPSSFSKLDKLLVREHLVHLAGLTPDTIYYYKVMSKGYATDVAISEVHSFTTLGEVPVAIFINSDLSISPTEVNIGEMVTISVLVSNTGTASGSYKVTLKVNGVVEAIEVTLDAGANKEVTFTIYPLMAATYSVDVNGLTGSFTVKEKPVPAPPPAPPPPPPPEVQPFPWPLVGGIIGGVIIVGLLVFFWIRRRVA